MKHLRLFKTNADYESATLELPNVSYVEETKIVGYKSNKPEVIEYQFDLRNVEWEDSGFLMLNKKINGNFSELFDKVLNYVKTYGVNYAGDNYSLGEYGSETPLENLKISALVDDTRISHLCWIDTNINSSWINWGFNNVKRGAHNGGGECGLTRDCFTLDESVI